MKDIPGLLRQKSSLLEEISKYKSRELTEAERKYLDRLYDQLREVERMLN